MSKPTQPDPLAAIDPAALAQVTGGTSGGDATQALLSQLTGILDSIKSISTAGSAQGFNPQEMMLMMFMLQQRNQQQGQVVSPWGQAPQGYWIVK
jgi:hypothetical protein